MKTFLAWLEEIEVLEEGSKKEEIELEKLMTQAGFVKNRSKGETWWEKEAEGVGIMGMSVSKQPKIPAKQIFKTAMSNWRKNVEERKRLKQKREESK